MARQWPQLLAAVCACLGSLCLGILIGWTNTISDDLQNPALFDIDVEKTDFSVIGSLLALGACVSCFPSAILINKIGRKWTALLTIIPFSIGWIFIIFAQHVIMLYIARFILGMAAGPISIVVPIYTMEIGETDISVLLGTLFQLFVNIGILIAFVTGWIISLTGYFIFCAIMPFIFFIAFVFQYDSPVTTVKKGRIELAKKHLQYFRGNDFNPENEIKSIQIHIDEEEKMKGKFKETMKQRKSKKAAMICLLLTFFQQFSGITVIMFYSSAIFETANSDKEPEIQTIMIGIIQVVVTVISSFAVDRFGRKILLVMSATVMALTLLLLGIFFTLLNRIYSDPEELEPLEWLPLMTLCGYVAGFSLGFGPIPWMISAELFSPEIKPIMASIAATINWFFAFIVTLGFLPLSDLVGIDICFYLFTIIVISSILFVIYVMPETKNKTIPEIQEILGK